MSIEFTSEDDRSPPDPGQSLNSSLGIILAIFCIETLIRSILSRLESVLDLTWWGITDLKSKFSAPNFLFCSIFILVLLSIIDPSKLSKMKSSIGYKDMNFRNFDLLKAVKVNLQVSVDL